MRARLFGLFMLVALLLSALVPGGAAHASSATWTVTKLADTQDGTCDADCSLREAIEAAQNGDSIVFATGVTGVIPLGTDLYVSKSITITGPGVSALSLSGQNTNRVLYVASGTVHISNLTVTQGHDTFFGAGIFNNGNLTLDHVRITNNQVVASVPGGGAYGGGIYNEVEATLAITNSEVSHNTSDYTGGGIFNGSGSSLSLTNVVIDQNQITASIGSGAGIYIANPYTHTPGIVTLDRVSVNLNTTSTQGLGGGI